MNMIIGIDPGLVKTGWGVVRKQGSDLQYVACGTIKPNTKLSMSERLFLLNDELQRLIHHHRPNEAAIEETFVNMNPASTLKLGQARGALMLSLAIGGLSVAEYAPNLVKKTLTGVGRAGKDQVSMMVSTLLPQGRVEIEQAGEDAADALAVAICHAHHTRMEAA